MNDFEKKFRYNVKNYVNKHIPNWFGFMHIEDYEIRRKNELTYKFNNFIEDAERLFMWIPLNTSKVNIVNAIKNTYVTKTHGEDLPSELAFDRLYENVISPKPTVIYIKGKRGTGKTAALNRFFNDKAKELQNDGFTYFRCDAKKIEELDTHLISRVKPLRDGTNLEAKSISPVTLKEYIDVHNLYVALMHSRVDKFLTGFSIPMEYEVDDSMGQYGLFGLYLEEVALEDERLLWQEIVYDFRAAAELSPIDKSIRINDMFSFLTAILLRFRGSDISHRFIDHFHKFIRKNNEFKGIILTIDGLDNYSRVAPSSFNYYSNLLRHLEIFLENDKDNRYYLSTIIALRPESYAELKQEAVTGYSKFESKVFSVSEPDVKKIIVNRLNVAIDAKSNRESYFSFVFTAEKANGLFAAFLIDLNSFFDAYIDAFVHHICSTMKMSENDIIRLKNDKVLYILNLLFSSNVRSMLRNVIGTYAHCREYYDNFLGENYVDSFSKWSQSSPQLLFEGSLVLGRRVIVDDSQEISPARRGRWCPPLFAFSNKSGETDTWNGLGLFRVLQYISKFGSSTEHSCIESLKYLDYSERLSRWFFGRALMYGLIEVDEIRVSENNVPFKISDKGSFILNQLLNEDGLTYYLGTCSLFPREFTLDDSYVTLHGDEKGSHRDFSNAVLSVGLILFRCINQAHKIEIKALGVNQKNSLLSIFPPIFQNDIHDKWFRRFNLSYQRYKKSRGTNLEFFWRAKNLQNLVRIIEKK
jgi:hypothetical protein